MTKTNGQNLDKVMDHSRNLIQSESDPAVRAELEKRTQEIIKDNRKKKPWFQSHITKTALLTWTMFLAA
jgi:hypothetical protein